MNKTAIAWTEMTWNPVTGCTPVSPACDNCYAKRTAETRMVGGKGGYPADEPFRPTFHENRIRQPYSKRTPSTIFISSMGDLCHEQITDDQIAEVLATVIESHWHRFILLTKRIHRLWLMMNSGIVQRACEIAVARSKTHNMEISKNVEGVGYIPNLAIGTTAEDIIRWHQRVSVLVCIRAARRFASCEPMIGPIEPGPELDMLDCVVAGGETGPCARPSHPDWFRKLRDVCGLSNVQFMFKHWGEWACVYDRDKDDPDMRRCPEWHERDQVRAHYLNAAGGYGFHGDRVVFMRRVGKDAAGRLLDGVEHNGMIWGDR